MSKRLTRRSATELAGHPAIRRVSRRSAIELAILGLLAYVPLLLNSRGSVAADTKLYLYLDPKRLLSDAPWTWDTRQFGGWVPHQVVGYLWPAGPYYWLCQAIGVPDWVAQRVWMATLLFVAGAGIRWAARKLGFGTGATVFVPIVAAIVYELSPYVLPYISRTSVLLAPWAGLGWLIGLTVLAARHGGWRYPALFALIIATIGGSNGTALVMIAPAPILYLLDAAARRAITWRRALAVGARIGALSIAVSLWWAAGVYIQSKHGADVLAYSETVQSTSFTSSAPEVLRGLGYWLFYVRDAASTATAASGDYQTSTALIGWGWILVVAGFAGIALVRWTARGFAALCVLAGVVLAVGVHPIDNPSPLMQLFADHPRSSLVLALRSSSRAVPLSLFGLALGAAVGASWFAARWRTWGKAVPAFVVLVAALNIPAMWSREYVDAGLLHTQEVPTAWQQAADALDADPDGGRVLLLPGMESAAYRWGYTVDPVLPGISNRDLITRDWLPLGSPPLMDLLYALDDRFQDGTIEAAAIAPVARLLGADTVMVANDTAFERFRTVRPEQAWAVYQKGVPGLGAPRTFGDPVANVPSVPMIDDSALTVPAVGEALPPVALFPVQNAPAEARAAGGPLVLVAGSGDGVIDAASAGIVDGSELLGYTADTDDVELADQLTDGASLVVTDSNRDRAHHWRTSQDVTGFTEGPGTALLTDDPFDQRLPVFTDPASGEQTTAEQRGPVTATATNYGEPNAYRPEDRPALAIDGDPSTAWVTADRADPTGQAIELTADRAVDSLTLRQPLDDGTVRWITGVRISLDGGDSFDVELGPDSLSAGQAIALPHPATKVRVEITATNLPRSGFYPGQNAVGFSEVDLGLGPTDEVVVLPSRALAAAGASTPLDIVMSRLHSDAAHRWRDDAERRLSRSFTLGQPVDATVAITARLSPRASDEVLASLTGTTMATADRRIAGRPVAAGWAAHDGDTSTAWTTPFEAPAPSALTIPLGGSRTVDHLTLTTLVDADHAQPTSVEVSAGGVTQTVGVPDPAADGSRRLDFPAVTGDAITLRIVATDGATTLDRRLWESVALPVAVAEVGIDGVATTPPPGSIDSGCRSDLVTIDGTAVPARVTGDWASLVAGETAQVELCGATDVQLAAGEHVVRSAPGLDTGIDIDRVVLHAGPDAQAQTPIAVEASRGRDTRTYEVAPCPAGCWLVQGEGWNTGWSASDEGHSLGEPVALDGGMNAWWLSPSDSARTVTVRWGPQRLTWIALGLSLAAVLGCVVLGARRGSLRDRRRRLTEPEPVADVDGALGVTPNRSWVAVPVGLVAGALVAGIAWGIVCAVLLAAGVLAVRRWIPAVAGVALVAASGLYVLVHQRRGQFGAGFGWVGEFGRAQRPALAAVVLLVVSVVVADWERHRQENRPEGGAPADD